MNEQHAEAHAIMYNLVAWTPHGVYAIDMVYISMNIYCCFILTEIWEVAKFRRVRIKRQVNFKNVVMNDRLLILLAHQCKIKYKNS
ncbi:MAG: hypothetical protein K2H61_02260 [Muribaculaceae bacterium]|nr:hypothetical protein [Muribaculaceae bacterium]